MSFLLLEILPLSHDFIEFFLRFVGNFLIVFLVLRFSFYPNSKQRDLFNSFFLMGQIVFLICYFLSIMGAAIGVGFGLFAVFSIIRFRTSLLSIREITYLFLIIGMAVMNALADLPKHLLHIISSDLIILALSFFLEKIRIVKHLSCKTIFYDKIELIQNQRREEMIADLQLRTGISKIEKIESGSINFLKDIVELKIYYYNSDNQINMAEKMASNANSDTN